MMSHFLFGKNKVAMKLLKHMLQNGNSASGNPVFLIKFIHYWFLIYNIFF